MIQLTVEQYEQIAANKAILEASVKLLEFELNASKNALKIYMRFAFDDAKSKSMHESIIDHAIALKMPQDWINELQSDLNVKP